MLNPEFMICLIAGTNRPHSQTLRVTHIYQKIFEAEGIEVKVLDLHLLPADIFLPSAYAQKPASFEPYLQTVLDAEGVLIVTPEYNGGVPGVLKYFIDMLKFPESFEKKPVAFVGLAAGMWGALRPVEQLQAIFAYRNAFLFNERVFLPRIEAALTPENDFAQPMVKELVHSQVKNFIQFCRKIRG